MARIASLDLGTNTFRLLVAEVSPGEKPRTIKKEQIITRLGGDFDRKTGRISQEALRRAQAALVLFAGTLREYPADSVIARATEIVRKASNGNEFLDMACRLLDAKVKTLSPEDEAGLALKGILAYNPTVDGNFITLDIGGGSTEIALVGSDGIKGWVSMPLGVVDLSERIFADKDPPSAEARKRCEREVREILEEARGKLSAAEKVETVIGTGGTATSLAVIDLGLSEYNENAVQNYCLSLEKIVELERRLVSLTFKERAGIFPLGGGREDVIIPGAIITRATLETFKVEKMLVSDTGLLEGLAMAGAEEAERR